MIKKEASFVEWVMPAVSTQTGCTVRVKAPSGAQMQIEVTNLDPSGLVTLVRGFVH
jgi:hypothetical protein